MVICTRQWRMICNYWRQIISIQIFSVLLNIFFFLAIPPYILCIEAIMHRRSDKKCYFDSLSKSILLTFGPTISPWWPQWGDIGRNKFTNHQRNQIIQKKYISGTKRTTGRTLWKSQLSKAKPQVSSKAWISRCNLPSLEVQTNTSKRLKTNVNIKVQPSLLLKYN